MSIRSVDPSPSLPSASSPGSLDPSTDRSAPAPASSVDDVHLSHNVQALQTALQDTSHDVDVTQVVALRQAVADGLYQPNAVAIADGMIASAKELIRPRKKGARDEAEKF